MSFVNVDVWLKPTCPFPLRLRCTTGATAKTTNLTSHLGLCSRKTTQPASQTTFSGPPLILPRHLSKLQLVSFGRLYEAPMCEAALSGKAKQTGWPRDKESATQRHVAAKPSQSTSPNPPNQPTLPFSHDSEALTLLLEPHKPFHTLSLEPREGTMEEEGGANSDSYSPNVTTSQRGPHDTATKSELMDSFFSPANMTGGVCVRVRGCGRRTGGW